MTFRNLSTALGLVTVLAFATTADAWPGGGHGRHGSRGDHMRAKLEKLDLTPETREQVEGLLEAAKQEGETLRSDLEAAHEQMRELLEQEEPETDRVLSQADVVGGLQLALRKHRLKTMLEVRALLTPEQREELHAQRREHPHHGFRGHGCNHGDDGER